MDIKRIASFSQNGVGGNPAGVALLKAPVTDDEMARIAAEVGYSETAFAVSQNEANSSWRVRYFSPDAEVPFCGHATIALGAVLGEEVGAGIYDLVLNDAEIVVEARRTTSGMEATLSSPPTRSQEMSAAELEDALALFSLDRDELDAELPPARIHGGSDHLMLALKDRARLAAMAYNLEAGQEMMRRHGVVTIMLAHADSKQNFNVRNAFAFGGVFEDPATGAAAAAFAGYLRDCDWPHGGHIILRQGEDMGQPCLIDVKMTDEKNTSVRVSGQVRQLTNSPAENR